MIVSFKNDFPVRITVFLLFVVLLTGSIYYYQERMLFCDAAHIFFEIANTGKLQIQENRFGSFITQLFPLIATKAHIPLKEALILYSISFNLFYLTVAAILLFRFKNTKLGILFAFYFVLFVSETYFWTNNEIHQAMGWCFLLFGIIHNYKQQPKQPIFHFIVVIILAVVCLFTHPLMLFVFPFLWLFTLFEKYLNPYNKKQILFLSFSFIIILGLKYYSMNNGGYDANKIHGATHFSVGDLWNAFCSKMAKETIDRLIKDYFFIPILFGLGLLWAFLQKKYKKIALICFFSISYFLAICLTYNGFFTVYIESEWMPFSIITGILFVYYFTPYLNTKWLCASLLLIFAVRINSIILSAKVFETRNKWTFTLVNKMKQQGIMKGYVCIDDSVKNILRMHWGCPIESIMASALSGETPQRTFFAETKEGIHQRTLTSRDVFIAPFRNIDSKELNPNYFIIDTMQQYQEVK